MDNLAYEHDPEYRAALDSQHDELVALGKRRSLIAKNMRELVSAAGSKENAEKLPQWAKLAAEAEECDKLFEANRKKTEGIVRERIKRAVRDTERVKSGRANAIKISK